MQLRFVSKQRNHDHGHGHGRNRMAKCGPGRQNKRQHHCEGGGSPHILIRPCFQNMGGDNQCAHTRERGHHEPGRGLLGNQGTDTAQQADETERADAGNPLPFIFFPVAPSPLYSDQKTNGQCGQQLDYHVVGSVHSHISPLLMYRSIYPMTGKCLPQGQPQGHGQDAYQVLQQHHAGNRPFVSPVVSHHENQVGSRR